ncbi:MAG: Na/Pi cotransporter family protein [Paludibacteraceae bacterium]|nr:Na/Pi cotransporter family protein [Paludibacteraceae bacterium]
MIDTIVNIMSLVGSLGLFLYGMKIMSEGLEKFAGDSLRNILAAMTKNRVMGVLTGVLVTALIQSSSATTVMVVSFVNAGLMTLKQSIGVIMGANIGTTVTAWLISAVGFKVDISAFAIPLLAVALPLIFSGQSKRKNIGEFVFGFSFLFMGLSYLQTAASNMGIGEIVANMLAHVPCESFFTILLFVIVGALVTMLVQASAATMAITLMLFDMHIPGFGFEQAAALAMGQNIGTTITAFMASLTANTQARRAALAHMFFNVFGVVVVLIIFYPACNAISWFVSDFMGVESNDLYKLSAFHTAFNIMNTLLLIGFVNQIEAFVCKVLPQKEQDEEYRLRYISAGYPSTAELSILEAQKEINNFAERCHRMFNLVKDLLKVEKDEEFNKLFSRIEKYESIADNMEVEIAKYLKKVSEGRLSNESKSNMQQMLRQISELESIGDSCYNLARTVNRCRQNNAKFTDGQMKHISEMMKLVDDSLVEMTRCVEMFPEKHDINASNNIENEINNYRNQLKNQNLTDVNAGLYNYQLGVYYIDFISECEKLGDYVVNVVEATI